MSLQILTVSFPGKTHNASGRTINLKQPVKILTDIQIPQSRIWRKRTTYIGSLTSTSSKLLFKMLRQFLKRDMMVLHNMLVIGKEFARYDVVITANVKTAQMVAFLRKLLAVKRPKHIILELMLDEESLTKTWRIKRTLQRFSLSSVDVIFVSSSEEVETYSKRLYLSKDRFKFIHFHTNISQPKMYFCPNRYILSAGRTGRDFDTFIQAVKTLPNKFVIISDRESAKGLNCPDNVRLFVDIPREHYLKFVQKCTFVVVPLQRLLKSTGQVVILEAMACGKPVIATDTVGTRDYIYPGFNGILVPPNDSGALTKAIKQLAEDRSLQERLSENSLIFIKENCTIERYVTKILDTAHDIL